MWKEAHEYLLELKVGEGYNDVVVTKRTENKIHLSNGVTVSIKKHGNGFLYLGSRSVRRGNRSYPLVNQVLRDIEGWLIMKLHSNHMQKIFK